MGAGPTKRQVKDGTRKALQRVAKDYGAQYMRAKPSTAPGVFTPPYVVKLSAAKGSEEAYVLWTLTTRLLRASNGEAALLFIVDTPHGSHAENISSKLALAAIGIPPLPVPPKLTKAQRLKAALEFVERIARYGIYIHPDESGSWSDDQAEDALGTLNATIANARDLAPYIVPDAPVKSGDEPDKGEGWYALGIGEVPAPEPDLA